MHIKIRPSFWIYLLFVGILDGFHAAVALLITILIHEGGHLIAGALLHEPFERIELTPVGGMIAYSPARSASKGIRGILLAAAGPISNYAALVWIPRLFTNLPALKEFADSMLIVNASMLLINLLPVLPLDGGRIVFGAGYYLFPVERLVTILAALGTLTGSLLVLTSIIGACRFGAINLSMMIAGVYLIFGSREHGDLLITGNIHAVIAERNNLKTDYPQTARVITVSPQTVLLSVLPHVCRTRKALFLLEDGEEVRLISQQRLFEAMVKEPHAVFAQVFAEK